MRRVRLALFGIVFLASAWVARPVEYDNSRSRAFLAASIAERGALDIDPYAPRTIDLSTGGGHAYSSKAIGLPYLAAPVWWWLRNATPLRDASDLDPTLLYLVRVATVGLPNALLALLLLGAARRLGAGTGEAAALALANAFGTLALLHGTLFSGHQTAAALVFAAGVLLARAAREEGSRKAAGAAAGLLLGWGVLCDYLAAPLALGLALYAVLRLRRGRVATLGAFLLGGAVPLAFLLHYNRACFGSLLSLSYANQATEEFRAGSEGGFLGVGLPSARVLLALLFSPARGLLFLSPFLLLAIPGFRRLWRERTWRGEAVLALGCPAVAVLMNTGFYGWHGGWSYGPRYVTTIVPFLSLLVAPAIAGRQLLFGGLAVLSFLLYLLPYAGCPDGPEVFRNPLVECVLPLLDDGYVADTLLGWEGSLRPFSFAVLAALLGLLAVFLVAGLRRIEPVPGLPTEAEPSPLPRQVGVLAGAILALALPLALLRTEPAPGTEEAVDVHYTLARLAGDAGEGRPSLLARAEREYALADAALSDRLRSEVADFVRLRFAALLKLARARRAEGKEEESAALLAQAREPLAEWERRTPSALVPALRLEAARLQIESGPLDLAAEALAGAEKAAPGHPYLLVLRADFARASGRPADARAAAALLLARAPAAWETASLLERLVDAARERGDGEEAEALLALVRGVASPPEGLALLLRRKGR